MEKIFSVPLNPKLTEPQFNEFMDFLQTHKHLIYDIYFTSRIKPFVQDAMGDIFILQEDYSFAIETALHIQRTFGIPVSATFNNIQVPPTQQNLDTFITNFKPLYDAGIRSATIPHTHWMATGQIKRAFPELMVKNTILRDVHTASEIVALAKVGFDYINLDRDLMRDKDTLLRIKTAKEWIKTNLGKDIKISLLANEGCLGACPMMVEHFEFNNNRDNNTPQYFNDPISRVSCPKWEVQDPAVHLKTANLPPWREDWEEFITDLGIDVFKMHGRESPDRMYETMQIIRKWNNNEELLFEGFERYLEDTNLVDKPINAWRKIIKNCKFDCWECQYCDNIYKKKSEIQTSELVNHVSEAVALSGIPTIKLDIPGLTSRRVQTLLNSLAQGVDTYLEVGSFLGATLCAVMKDNPITVFAVDNWSNNVQPENGEKLPPNDIQTFIENVKKYKGNSVVNVLDKDYLAVDVSGMAGRIKMFFYDGPHDEQSTAAAVLHYWEAFADEAILIFDDANWRGVVDGARAGLNHVGAVVAYEKMILNSTENSREWWNGLYIVVVRKSNVS
jgi:hypothetical protein